MNLDKKVGIFIFISIIIFSLLISVGGLYQQFKSNYYVETYFNESVNGLSVGSPVKYRGVTIGAITKIDLVTNVYMKSNVIENFIKHPYVYIQMSIYVPALSNSNLKFNQIIKILVKNGLRINISPEGITGTSVLELDFNGDRKEISNIEITWIPSTPYIPSTPSTLTQINELFKSFNDMMKGSNVAKLKSDFTSTLKGIENATNNLNIFIGDLKQNPSQLLFETPPHSPIGD
jgi:ABC-type transporter Mla subunit MlaD